MEITDRKKMEYQQAVKNMTPETNVIQNCFRAFWTGGLICMSAQVLTTVIIYYGVPEDEVSLYIPSILILISIFLTSIGIYDDMGKYAGAGTSVPITGFANTVASAAIEYKKEGYILGMGAKIFTIGGPVILYGLITSVIVGTFYYIFS